ncbi:hypothetical protein OE88DRAFT_1738908 [Heliocybe sulcata]|uniref:Uncharacterized protein n=1 Tax=Heliocybe sulcata TaxID=5364 RepID=A0A5C3MQJ3_9AGAM|nr:hypothetical protein OE88DRAFT_1738908 [Heliocybe sulcata]
MILVIVTMYLVSSAHLGLTFCETLRTFSYETDEALSHISYYQAIAVSLEFSNCIGADSILIWRAYVVWGKQLRIVAPLLVMLVATCTLSIFFASEIYTATAATPMLLEFMSQSARYGVPMAVMTVCTNLAATGLILGRIWHHQYDVKRLLGGDGQLNTYGSVVLVIMESGMIYSLTWIVTIILYARQSPAAFALISAISQIAGIAPTLIIVIVAMKAEAEEHKRKRELPILTTLSFAVRNTSEVFPEESDVHEECLTPLSIALSDEALAGMKNRKGQTEDGPRTKDLSDTV